MYCGNLLYCLFNIYITVKLFVISNCFKKHSNFNIIDITLYNNTDLCKISSKKQINRIISNNWYSIKKYDINISMVDIHYFYNNEKYNIIYKYPFDFEFPIKLKQSKIKLLYINDEINDMVMRYAGPMKDFYNMNTQHITVKDICNMNKISFSKEIFIVNSDLSEKNIEIDDIIDLKI
jgi:hypothetical protein